jgi:hypothetical protein
MRLLLNIIRVRRGRWEEERTHTHRCSRARAHAHTQAQAHTGTHLHFVVCSLQRQLRLEFGRMLVQHRLLLSPHPLHRRGQLLKNAMEYVNQNLPTGTTQFFAFGPGR